jgi:cytochrome c-type biogenesis protein
MEHAIEPLWRLVAVPLSLGLLGFVEPCSIGVSLLFLKSVEQSPPSEKIMQAGVFTITRAILMGMLGAIAALAGSAMIGFQRFGYVVLGALYLVLGMIYLSGLAGRITRPLGPSLSWLSSVRGSAVLAVFFGLTLPACAGPLLAASLGSAALIGFLEVGRGFLMLAMFGIGLSLPLVIALSFGSGRRILERLEKYSAHAPMMIGVLFVALGTWSVWFALSLHPGGK